jgi:DNA repair exonuclease SbcCD ATPase subunit
MIYLKKLKIKNLGRFVKQQEIDLFALSSLNQIDGQNLNTGGSSGAGKSSILKALEYVLGVNSTPTTVLKSRYADGAMEVVLVFEKNNEEYTVTRSTSSGLTVKTPTEEISGSNKESEQALLNILEIPQDLIRRILIKRQKEGGFFLNLTPKQSYSFLSGCLGLEEWTQKQEKIKTDIEKEKENFEKIKLLLIGKESYLESTKNSMASLLVPDTSRISILENEIVECNFKLAAAEESLKLLKESKLNKKSEIIGLLQ